MNILMMSKIFVESGVASHIKILSQELIKSGHIVYIASSNNMHEDFCNENRIVFFKNSFSLSPLKFISNIKALRLFLKEKKIDIVHCHHRTCGLYMHFLSKITGVPFVWSNHLDDIPSDFIHRITTFYGKKTICVSTDLKSFCIDKLKIPEKDVEVVIHGIIPEDYSYDSNYVANFKEKHQINDEKIIGLFARMAEIKGHSCLIDALSKMPKENLEKTKTVFFGGTTGEYADSLKEKIKELGLEKYIIFEGFVNPSQALSLSDITVLPSLKEGFPIVTVESFLMKTPHIRTKTAGYEDIAEGCIGIEIGDSDALCEELNLFASGKDYTEMVDKAFEIFEDRCTVESMAKHILKIYTEACK